jgi:hypothetical protein
LGLRSSRICAECRRLTILYFKLAGQHSVLLERQAQARDEEKADMEPLIAAAELQVQQTRRDFTEHRKTHEMPEGTETS